MSDRSRGRLLWRLVAIAVAGVAAACGSTNQVPVGSGELDAAGSEAAGFDVPAEADGGSVGSSVSPVEVGAVGQGSGTAGSSGAATGSSSGVAAGSSSVVSGGQGSGSSAGGGSTEPVRVAFSIYDASGVGTYVPNSGASQNDYETHLRRSREEIAAFVKHTNDTGGIGGRPVEAVPMVLGADDVLSEARMSAVCTEATEDHRASVFIDSQTIGFESTMACFAQHKTTFVGALSVRSVDAVFLESVAPFMAGSQAGADRIAKTMVRGLHEAGYFEGAKVGVLRIDSPTHRRIYENVLLPALKSVGVTPAENATFTPDDPGSAGAQSSSAVLRFKAAGVTHVMALVGYFAWTGFTQAAEAQDYSPQYGVSDYVDTANQAALFGPESQKKDALAVVVGRRAQVLDPGQKPAENGWVQRDFDPGNPVDTTPGMKRCIDILSAGTGRDYYKGSERGGTWHLYCDNYLLWLDAARRVGNSMTPSNWGDGLAQLGRSFLPAMVHSTHFAPGRFDGGASYRVAKYGPEGCKCFHALTPWQDM